MKLKDLKDVITDDSTVYLQTKTQKEPPLYYSSWRACKKDLKPDAWKEKVRLQSYGGIMIVFEDL